MPEIHLLQTYPRISRTKIDRVLTPENRALAERLDFYYYDGKREYGFGGFVYDGRWQAVAQAMKEQYHLTPASKVLIDRCDKGFLVFDLKQLIPGVTMYGLHPRPYALNHALEGYGKWFLIQQKNEGKPLEEDPWVIEEKARKEITPFLVQGDSCNMPFPDRYFDTVISINNACAYPPEDCKKVIREIMRVSKNNGEKCYIQNDSWRTEAEKEKLMQWTLLCQTFLDTTAWAQLYQELGYRGDWSHTIIE